MLDKHTASEFDFIVGIDASGSMSAGSTRFSGKSRWEELQETCFGIASQLNKLDDNGIDVVVFGGTVEMHENVTPEKITSIFNNRDPNGSTPMHEALKKVVAKQAKSKKNTVAIIFTDGAPDDPIATAKIIIEASNKLIADENLTFLFVQIGNDPKATKYLQTLDNELSAAKFDIVDVVTSEEADKMTPLELIDKAIRD